MKPTTFLQDRARLREILFRLSVLLKGLDAILEILGAIALWLVSPGFIASAVQFLTQDEIAEDPHDLVANALRHAAARFSLSSEHFMAVYLLAHGLIKIAVVAALLRNRLWAYPVAIAVFTGFIAYQLYRYTLTGGIGLILLTVFDLFLIALIWLEYRAQRRHRTAVF
ncbi:MAG: DUF2127 domain-containing protein [Acidobacteriaceae bacterium]